MIVILKSTFMKNTLYIKNTIYSCSDDQKCKIKFYNIFLISYLFLHLEKIFDILWILLFLEYFSVENSMSSSAGLFSTKKFFIHVLHSLIRYFSGVMWYAPKCHCYKIKKNLLPCHYFWMTQIEWQFCYLDNF